MEETPQDDIVEVQPAPEQLQDALKEQANPLMEVDISDDPTKKGHYFYQ